MKLDPIDTARARWTSMLGPSHPLMSEMQEMYDAVEKAQETNERLNRRAQGAEANKPTTSKLEELLRGQIRLLMPVARAAKKQITSMGGPKIDAIEEVEEAVHKLDKAWKGWDA